MSRLHVVPILLTLAAMPAEGVLLRDGNGTQNTMQPLNDPGWGNVGELRNSTAVLIANGWVLTARSASMTLRHSLGEFSVQGIRS